MTSAQLKIQPTLPLFRDDDPIVVRQELDDASDGAGLTIRVTKFRWSLGSVLVAATENGLCAILLGNDANALRRDLDQRFPQAHIAEGATDATLEQWARDVADFLNAPARGLDVPLDPQGTEFQKRVWGALREIPAGATASYSEIAARLGAPKEAYAVGEACAANMIAVAIPCHRVVRKDGGLAGFRWGTWRKHALLKREGAR